jgi:hypothetical protein
MIVLQVIGYIVGYAFILAVTVWLIRWGYPITAAAFKSVFKRH